MSNLIGRIVNVNGQEGEIVRTRGTSYYEVQPFDLSTSGSYVIRKEEAEQFLVKESAQYTPKLDGARGAINKAFKEYYDKNYSKFLKLKIEDIKASKEAWEMTLENGYKRTFNVGDSITLDVYVKASERVFRVSGTIINLHAKYIVLQEPKSYSTVDCNFEDDEFQYVIF